MNNLVIGLNSGTSFDGIDTALVNFKNKNLKPIFIDGFVYDYPKPLKEKLRNFILNSNNYTLKDFSQLNFLLGELFAEAAVKILKRNSLNSKKIILIASHGQTIYHHPELEKLFNYNIRSTLQLGESSVIAYKTRIKTISNFREADIAAGGQGAPLMPYLDYILFNDSKNIKAVLNIGGISNVTITGKNITPIAFDTGPGNALIDLLSKKYFNKDFDQSGNIAKKGEIYYAHVEHAINNSYFRKKPPKSTGKEYFNLEFIERYFAGIVRKEDKIATVTYVTARVIQQAFIDFIFPKYNVTELVISGGGIKNATLMKHLMHLLPDLRFTSSDEYKIPSKFKEAILFALLGYTCHLGKENNIPTCTGAKKNVILGKICQV